jgi:hypothetical protein
VRPRTESAARTSAATGSPIATDAACSSKRRDTFGPSGRSNAESTAIRRPCERVKRAGGASAPPCEDRFALTYGSPVPRRASSNQSTPYVSSVVPIAVAA